MGRFTIPAPLGPPSLSLVVNHSHFLVACCMVHVAAVGSRGTAAAAIDLRHEAAEGSCFMCPAWGWVLIFFFSAGFGPWAPRPCLLPNTPLHCYPTTTFGRRGGGGGAERRAAFKVSRADGGLAAPQHRGSLGIWQLEGFSPLPSERGCWGISNPTLPADTNHLQAIEYPARLPKFSFWGKCKQLEES